MMKHILALASVAVLSACSSGSSTPSGDTTVAPPVTQPPAGGVTPPVVTAPGGGTPPTGGGVTQPVITAPGGGAPPTDGTTAGTYVGDFGSGRGVYVVDNDNNISGLALAADGSAESLFGNIGEGDSFSGTLNSYFHSASVTPDQGVFGAGDPSAVATPAFNLNILAGQTIESQGDTSVRLVAATDGAVTPANSGTLDGTWSGRHRFCGADTTTSCSFLTTEITFSGTSLVGGTDVVNSDGDSVFPVDINGTITDFDDVSLVTFSWGDLTYNGSVFFAEGSTTELVIIGETADAETDRRTIASLLTK